MSADLLTSAGAALIGGAGVIALARRLHREFDRPVTALTIVLLCLATPVYEAVAHPVGMDDVSAFALVAALGLIAASTRMATGPGPGSDPGSGSVDAVSEPGPGPGLDTVTPARPADATARRWRARPRIARAVALAALAAVPLVIVAFAGPSSPRVGVLNGLFSPAGGLLSLTPVVYAALVGMLAYARRDPLGALVALVAVLLWTRAGAPHAASAAALAPGLAVIIQALRTHPLLAAAPVVGAALLWNYWLMVQYTMGSIPKDAPVEFAALVRQQADVHTRPPYIYPFAFPANVLFAWKERLPIDRYDSLALVPRATSFDLSFDRGAQRFLLEGWHAPGTDSAGPVWWTRESSATLAIPLAPAPGSLSVAITARARELGAPVVAELALEVNGSVIGRFAAPSDAPSTGRFTIAAARARQLLRAGYNRLAIVTHEVRRADGTPERLSRGEAWPIAVYRVRIAPAPSSATTAPELLPHER